MNQKRLESIDTVYTHADTINLKNHRGITLVALVVTIVVLLILAGVSINLVLGQNGLITQAQEAKRKTEETAKSEQNELKAGANYIKQTVGVQASGITADDYGKVVTNYNADEKTWEIFYADDKNVYLIARENCGSQSLEIALSDEFSYNGTSDFDGSEKFKKKFPAVQAGWLNKIYTEEEGIKYNSSYINMKCTEYLLDSTIWNQKYLDSSKADWVIGGPTREILVASYNNYSNKNIDVGVLGETGYADFIRDCIPIDALYNNGYCYWVSAPSVVKTRIRDAGYEFYLEDNKEYNVKSGIRPVACLKSSATLILSEDGNTYSIK